MAEQTQTEKLREQIADIVWGINNGEVDCLIKADRILSIPEIQKGLELYFKAQSKITKRKSPLPQYNKNKKYREQTNAWKGGITTDVDMYLNTDWLWLSPWGEIYPGLK